MREKIIKVNRHGRRMRKRRRRNPAVDIDWEKLDLVKIGRSLQVAGKVIELWGEITQMGKRDDATEKAETKSN